MAGTLLIQKEDIVKLSADCIVNAANSALRQGSGVCGAIFAAAGAQQLEKACSQYPGCPTGSAVLTPAFHLNARYIAHAVGPQWKDGRSGEAEKLRSAYHTALALAAQKGCRTIAFPLISAGIYGCPKKAAWQIAIRAIRDFLKTPDGEHMTVTIAVLTQEDLDYGTSLLKPPAPVHTPVSQIQVGKSLCGYYLLQTPALRTSSSGKPFLSANLGDKTGAVNAICWDYSGPLGPSDEGSVVYAKGLVSEFRGSPQVTLDTLRPLGEGEEPDLSQLVPVAPIDEEEMFSRILALVDSLTDPQYQAVCREFIKRHEKALRQIPAAKSVHHGFLHGLLMHTGNMVTIADQLSRIYDQVVDRNLLITGTLLHDFAKREEFTFSQLGLVNGYSVKGQLLGHLVMGAQEVAQVCRELQIPEEKSILLQHMLLSHHGKPEYGAAVVPMCAESELLSLIDMLDSRMEIYRENLDQTPMGEFSGRIFPLDGSRIYRHYDPQA